MSGPGHHPLALTAQNLSAIGESVPVPEYDRTAVTAGIVHFGVGGFHRAHQAMYTDRVLASGATEWGICGVGVMPADRRMAEVLAAQDHLYTLVTKAPDGTVEARVIGSIVDYLYAPDDPEAVLEKLADPAVRIVSLTVTEGGYSLNQVTGEFDPSPAPIRADLAAGPGTAPATVFGLVTEGLRRRRDRGIPPFTVMSCDNLQGNGHLAAKAFTAYATAKDAELGAWVAAGVAFPNCMVDRITPVTTDADRATVAERFGIDDSWPVVCEPFTQWALEDHFPGGRPAWETVGAQLVPDVVPYELMKLRLLNASHQGIAYFGVLAGYTYVDDAAKDETIARFLLDYMEREARPTLAPVPGIDLDAYSRELIERFSNAGIRDTLARLAAESSDRIPKWLVPVIRANLEAGRDVTLSAAIVASWARYAEAVDEQGNPITVVDRLADERMAAAAAQASDPLAFVRNPDLFGDLATEERFTEPYLAALDSLHSKGAAATVKGLVEARPSG
ncbi:mannitol dehydrogenase family protein [Nakamurella lactea]|uniref:mannitol dehydrogenase family protein n=1 Tax=Nakamurella lactea TaxID=459515 RepID=UPI0003F6395D|nr:mannitol dehydrogenase family protein [Nakamurella lactea]